MTELTTSALIKHLKNQHAGFKSIVTRKRNEVSDLLATVGHPDTTGDDIARVKAMLPGIKDAWGKIIKITS